jgi:hypothetical protein
MKNLLFFIYLLTFSFSFANENVTIKKIYGNVNSITSTYNYVEKINETLIIGQYVEILSKKLSYTDKIYLYFFEEQFEKPFIKAWIPSKNDNSDNLDGINIMFKMKEFDVKGCLNVIENVLLQKGNLGKLDDSLEQVYIRSLSGGLNSILETKIYRPKEVNELKRLGCFNYYYQNGFYHFINTNEKYEKEIIIVDKIVDFQTLVKNILIVFINKDEFKIVKSKSEIKTLNIKNPDDFYIPHKISLIGNNKILIEFSFYSKMKNRVMVYFIDKDKLIQDIDEI